MRKFTSPRGTGASFQFIPGDSVEYHAGDRLVEEKCGIRFEPKFIYANNDELKQKMNLAIASNDLPDFFGAHPFDFYGQLVQSKLIKDVTDLWEKHAPKEWKDGFNFRNGLLWQPLRINGRVYGIPLTKFLAQDEKLTWVRTDWLEKIGAKEPPKTLDEVYKYAQEFVKAKVAGTDRPTIGLGINKDLNTWNLSTDPIFGAYGVMPGYWKKMADGKFVAYSTMPEAKEALALLAAWYKEGLLNKEFFTLDTNKSQQLVANGQVGLYFGPSWNPRGIQVDAIKNETARGNTKVAFTYGLIPTGPKGRGTKFTLPVQGAQCASAKVSDDDWVLALKQGIWEWQLTNPIFRWDNKWHGFEGYSYSWTPDGCKLVTGFTGGASVPKVLQAARLYDDLNETKYLEMLKEKYDKDPKQLDCYERSYVETTYQASLAQIVLNNQAKYAAVEVAEKYAIGNDYNGVPTATMIKELGNLNALEQAAYIDIIAGNKPISYFDEFVKEWKAKGGDKIAQEIAEAAARM